MEIFFRKAGPLLATKSGPGGPKLATAGPLLGRTTFAVTVLKMPTKKTTKRHRTAYTKDQIARLEASFAVQPYPDLMLREEIAESLELTEHSLLY